MIDIADKVTPPIEGRVKTFSLTTSSAAHALPSQWGSGRRYVTLQSPVAFYLLFGDSGVAVDETETSDVDQCIRVGADQPVTFMLESTMVDTAGNAVTHLAIKGTSASYVYSYLSSSEL